MIVRGCGIPSVANLFELLNMSHCHLLYEITYMTGGASGNFPFWARRLAI